MADWLKLLLIPLALTAVGAVIAFDLFGFVSKYRVSPSPRTIEAQEKYGRPDIVKVVGVVFLSTGVVCLAFCLVIGLVDLAR
jgi:hypothetical protein